MKKYAEIIEIAIEIEILIDFDFDFVFDGIINIVRSRVLILRAFDS